MGSTIDYKITAHPTCGDSSDFIRKGLPSQWYKKSKNKKKSLPLVGKKLYRSVDLETGKQCQPNTSPLAFEGSYSSTLRIRCDGQRVTVGGNPSRWQRPDNLFGYATLEDCVAVYNRVLLELGLPPFSKCTKFDWLQSGDNDRSRLWTDGAVITRIDWTRNLGVGRDNVLPFLRGLSTQALNRGKLPYLYPNGRTTDWNKGSSWRYDKIYDKGHDMACRKKLKKLKTDEERDYYKRLIDYCEEMGIAREEHTFKQKFLSRHNFCFYGMVRESDFEPHLNEIDNAMKRLEIAAVDYITIADQLLDREIVKSRQAANATQNYAMPWFHAIRWSITVSTMFIVPACCSWVSIFLFSSMVQNLCRS
ncbi:MAG: hypothetical protein M3A44_00360 [Gammaproteobacteria bacterium]